MEIGSFLVLMVCLLVFINCDKNFIGLKSGEFEKRVARISDTNTVIQEIKEMQKNQMQMVTNVTSNQNNLFNKMEENQIEMKENQYKIQIKQNEIETNVNTIISNQNHLFNKMDELTTRVTTVQNTLMDKVNAISRNLSESLETELDIHREGVLESNEIIQTQLTEMMSTTQSSNEIMQTQLTAVRSTTQNLRSSISSVARQIQTVQENVAPKLYCNNQLDLDDCLEKHFTEQQQLQYFIKKTLMPIWLVGGKNKYEGRVEVSYHGRQGTICDDDWDNIDARVACRMLGYTGGTALQGHGHHNFGVGTGEILLSKLKCSGSERSLFDCVYRGIGVETCSHIEDAGVICNP